VKKIIFLYSFCIAYVSAMPILISYKDIKYKQNINYKDLDIVQTNKKVRCKMFDIEKLLKHPYQAKRYILKGTPICEKDVQPYKKHIISYDFGNIIIQREAQYVGETSKYVKIKDQDGKIEKIYKDGRLR